MQAKMVIAPQKLNITFVKVLQTKKKPHLISV